LLLREADFAFKQAFAFCPYSPEAVIRYVTLLLAVGRIDDALLVVETCHKLDPAYGQFTSLLDQLRSIKKQPEREAQTEKDIAQLEQELYAQPADFKAAFALANKYLVLRQTDRAAGVLKDVLNNPQAGPDVVAAVVKGYAQLNELPGVVAALKRYVQLLPDHPEGWYDLATAQTAAGDKTGALQNLRRAIDLSNRRLATNPGARDLRAVAEKDTRLEALRALPEYRSSVPPL
jgi:thioredoxin-like negative regulator of GroEL